jgi:hypothetical protein
MQIGLPQLPVRPVQHQQQRVPGDDELVDNELSKYCGSEPTAEKSLQPTLLAVNKSQTR